MRNFTLIPSIYTSWASNSVKWSVSGRSEMPYFPEYPAANVDFATILSL